MQLPTQADISIKHLWTFPLSMSLRALMQFSTPSMARYVYYGLEVSIVLSIPPVVGKNLARLYSS